MDLEVKFNTKGNIHMGIYGPGNKIDGESAGKLVDKVIEVMRGVMEMVPKSTKQ